MGTPLTFGLGVNANETVLDMIEKSVAAEGLGLKYLWIADSSVQLYGPIVASAIASRTSKIRIGLGLMSVLLHTPSQIADAVISLSDAYGDRFDLCIGVGDRRQLGRVGIHVEKIRSLPLRVLQARRDVVSRLSRAGVRTKIWLGAQGPRILRIAKNFDGILLNYSRPEMIRWAIAQTGVGPKRRVTIGTYSPSYVHLKPKPWILRLAKASAAVVALGTTAKVLRRFRLEEKLRMAREMAEGSGTVEDLLTKVPDDVVEDFSITMRATRLESYLTNLSGLGVSHIVFAYPQNYSVETVKELGKALDLAS